MSMYSDNEQVGSLGKSYTKIDEQITTQQALQRGAPAFLFVNGDLQAQRVKNGTG